MLSSVRTLSCFGFVVVDFFVVLFAVFRIVHTAFAFIFFHSCINVFGWVFVVFHVILHSLRKIIVVWLISKRSETKSKHKRETNAHSNLIEKDRGRTTKKMAHSWKFYFLRPYEWLVKQLACRFQNAILPFKRWNMTGNCVAVVRQATKPLHS